MVVAALISSLVLAGYVYGFCFRVKLHSVFATYNNNGLFLGLVLPLNSVVSPQGHRPTLGLPCVCRKRPPSQGLGLGYYSRMFHSFYALFSDSPVSHFPDDLLLIVRDQLHLVLSRLFSCCLNFRSQQVSKRLFLMPVFVLPFLISKNEILQFVIIWMIMNYIIMLNRIQQKEEGILHLANIT